MKKILLGFFLFFQWILLGQEQLKESDRLSFDEYFFDAMNYRIKEDYKQSNDVFFNCLAIDPESDVVLFKIAQNFLALKQYNQSEEYLQKAIAIHPENKWYQMTFIRLKIKEGEAAHKILKHIEEFRNKAKNKYLVASLYRELYSRNNQAPKQAAQQATINNKPEKNKKNLYNLLNTGAYQEVIKEGEKKLEVTPDDAQTYFYIARAYHKLSRPKKALEYLDMGMDFVIDDVNLKKSYYQLYKKLYEELGKTKKAREYQLKIKRL